MNKLLLFTPSQMLRSPHGDNKYEKKKRRSRKTEKEKEGRGEKNLQRGSTRDSCKEIPREAARYLLDFTLGKAIRVINRRS